MLNKTTRKIFTAPSTSMSTSLPVVSTAATSTAAPAGTTTTPPAAASTKQAEGEYSYMIQCVGVFTM
ncbi:hypothetical protein DPMN_103953 [Dreissena polymorpha]|uniref:Uncharacterized protein n=1 Tax=Dreissena polymorpha TaxID=45954 RepID=A0A9D4K0P3_DREPO|nr:hypothetical protein DPMN_103953 [Dreissena polymorpha]